ncbi:hypothetical protein BGZ73_008729 [Actinomortierella ambigua]|nr:hypothetical protein BGZ73_008729 [Actinomortierella ambigua]
MFLFGGQESVVPPFAPSDKVLTIPLGASFDTTSFAAVAKRPILKQISSTQAAPFKDSSKILLNQNITGQLVAVYDIAQETWSNVTQDTQQPLQPRRSSVGVALDESSGLHILYGGSTSVSELSKELDILDTEKGLGWNITTVPADFGPVTQPIMLYIPGQQRTLIMGGCVAKADCFKTIYLVRAKPNGANVPTVEFEVKLLGDTYPVLRTAACAAMADENKVLLYGGYSDRTLNDTWVLDTNAWVWSQVSIKNLPADGREGASCVRGAGNQIVVAGGYYRQGGDTKQFSVPQLAVIDMTNLEWSTQYKFRESSQGLSTAALVGISAGCAALLVAILAGVGFFCWRRKRKPYDQANSSTMEISTLGSSSPPSNGSQVSCIQKPSVNTSTQTTTDQRNKATKERLPLIISPYRPSPTPTPTTTTATTTASNYHANRSAIDVGIGASSIYHSSGSSFNVNQSSSSLPSGAASTATHSRSSKTTVAPVTTANWGMPAVTNSAARPRVKTAYSYNRDSARLDSAARDAQHQAYAKQQMLAEVRRDFPSNMQASPLIRKGTLYHELSPVSPDEPDTELSSTVMRLRPIELGEESGSKPVFPKGSPAHKFGTKSALGGGKKSVAFSRKSQRNDAGVGPEGRRRRRQQQEDENEEGFGYGMTAMLVSEFMDSPQDRAAAAEDEQDPTRPGVFEDPRLGQLIHSGANSQTTLIHHDHLLDRRR